MIKKAAMGTLAIATIGGMVFGTDVFSYARTTFHSAQNKIRSEVPLEFEIERAREEVAQLLPQVRRSMHLIAEEQVEVANLRRVIEKRELALEDQEEAILALTADLKSGETQFVYAGHAYSQREVEKDLAERFNRFKTAEETLRSEQELLRAKETALETHRETLEGMLSQRKSLEVELERLEARLQTINARKQIASIAVDDSQLNRVKSLIDTINKRLDVEDAVLTADGDFSGLIPVEEDNDLQTKDIAQTVDEYFGRNIPVEVVKK